MKAFTKDECINMNKILDEIKLTIYTQESDTVKRSGVNALIDGIKSDMFDAEIYDLPMLITEGQLYALTMLYLGIGKYRTQISDIIWDAYFRNVKESV